MPLDQCPMAMAIKEDRPVRGVEIIVERPDGSRGYVLPYPTPLHDDAGNLTGAVNVLVDITELRRAEDGREEERRALSHPDECGARRHLRRRPGRQLPDGQPALA